MVVFFRTVHKKKQEMYAMVYISCMESRTDDVMKLRMTRFECSSSL